MIVTIVGAGCAGAALARCLNQRGIAARLFERARAPSSNAYWISLYRPEYMKFLEAIGVDESSFVRAVSACSVIDSGRNQLQVNRGRLENFLREGLDVQWDRSVQSTQKGPDEKSHILTFSNGTSLETPFFVAADGEHSELRKALTLKSELQILPYVAYHGSRTVDQHTFEKVYKHCFDPHGSKWLLLNPKKDTRLKVEVVEDEKRSTVLVRWTYSRVTTGNEDRLHRPTRDKKSAKDIPKELFDEFKELGSLPPPFDVAFDPAKAHGDRVLHWLQRKSLLDRTDIDYLVQQNIAMIGQAAHTEPIIGGRGANGALVDAVELAEHISRYGTSKLSTFYKHVLPRWSEGVERAEEALESNHRMEHDESRL